MQSWADAEWFTSRPEVPASLTVTVFKVNGETNTDDLSPAPDASTRPDIPLHALAMLKNARPGIEPDEAGARGPEKQLAALIAKGHPVAYVGDVVGTGSSRKSATNSVLWFTGAGHSLRPEQAFRRRLPRRQDRADLLQHHGRRRRPADRARCLQDGDGRHRRTEALRGQGASQRRRHLRVQGEVRRDLRRGARRRPHSADRRPRAHRARAGSARARPSPRCSALPAEPAKSSKGFTLAQKIVGRACGLPEGQGVRPGAYCEPKMTTVGSQDTTGPMTRDELKDLACLGFSADLIMQSFCHTAAYPKTVDVKTHQRIARASSPTAAASR